MCTLPERWAVPPGVTRVTMNCPDLFGARKIPTPESCGCAMLLAVQPGCVGAPSGRNVQKVLVQEDTSNDGYNCNCLPLSSFPPSIIDFVSRKDGG